MAQTKLFGKNLKDYEDIDIDSLLETLSPEQLEELGDELIDPDDSCVPPNQRCKYRTDKKPTGPFNRKLLVDFLEKKAREEKDWEEPKPFTKEKRGKLYKPKEEEKIQINDDDSVETEWDEVLRNATEEELVDLAAILGFHGMLNQVQYHDAFVDKKVEGEEEKEGAIGFQGVARHQQFKLVPDEPPNSTDVEGSLKKIKDNDPELKELNLNNIKNISLERLKEIGEALKSNTHLEKLHMANTRATDKVALSIADGLHNNKTLKVLNLESNYVKGQGIIAILEAISDNQVLEELRLTNQRPQILGCRVEMQIAELLRENHKMLRFGIFLEIPAARIRCQEYVKRNNDHIRKTRMGIDDPIPPPEKKTVYKTRAEREAEAAANKTEEAPVKKEEPKKEETEDDDDDEDETSETEDTTEEEEE
eukprot:GHVU01152881.1.p1 GENE.GHVU01152881.1~~GHVU01152881.1.p1  ORF type:complete len:421 (+),score=105.00 GHVU01152881.1:129-1391(+)